MMQHALLRYNEIAPRIAHLGAREPGTSLDEGANVRLTVFIRQGRAGVQAYCPDVPGCSAVGPTEQAALTVLRRRVLEQLGSTAVPTPPKTRRASLEIGPNAGRPAPSSEDPSETRTKRSRTHQ